MSQRRRLQLVTKKPRKIPDQSPPVVSTTLALARLARALVHVNVSLPKDAHASRGWCRKAYAAFADLQSRLIEQGRVLGPPLDPEVENALLTVLERVVEDVIAHAEEAPVVLVVAALAASW